MSMRGILRLACLMLSRRSCLLSVPSALALGHVLGFPGPAGAESRTPEPSPAGAPGEAVSTVGRAVADASAAAPASESVRAFSADMYRRLASGTTGNLACSPYSVMVALAMTRAGAGGRTAAEMDAVLRVPSSGVGTLHAGLNALDQLVAATSRRPGRDGAEPAVVLAGANSLWGQEDLHWLPTFLDTLASFYGAGMRLVDYASDPEGARRRINAWVGDMTRERIPELLQPGVITSDTILALVNALYFKAAWQSAFDARRTRDDAFTRADGTPVTTPMMTSGALNLGHTAQDGWQAVQLPYAGGELAMTVVLPDEGRLAEVEALLDGPRTASLLAPLPPRYVQVTMPRWTFRQNVSLEELLARMGMPLAFTNLAEFHAMADEEALRIDRVIHETFVAVDEHGTEAAAATAVVMVRSTSVMIPPPQPLPVVVDRPFLFVIHDLGTATPLFVGRVCDPTDS